MVLGNKALDISELAIKELAIIEERSRLSREMHDGPGQVFGYLGLKLDGIGNLINRGQTDDAIEELKEVQKVIKNASDDLRYLIMALRPSVYSEAGWQSILQDYLASLEQQTGIKILLNIQNEDLTNFSAKVALQLFRVIQEALNNVRKHAEASQVVVDFKQTPNETLVSITDNGIGFDSTTDNTNNWQFGIQVMKERILDMGGSLEIDSRPGRGTVVLVRLPIEVIYGI